MRIKGILFDKDGPLIDFFSLWLYAARRVIPEFIRGNDLEEKQNTTELENVLYESIGIFSDQIDPNGALAYKSYREIAQDMERALERLGIRIETDQIETQIRELFDQATHGEEAKMIPLGDLPELFQFLKKKNLYLGIATADTVSSAKKCMKQLGVLEYLDYIGGDDGKKRPKPYPDMLYDFAEKSGILPQQVMVAGDTRNDMVFAEQAKATSVGVLSGVSKERDLASYADYIVPSVEQIPALLDSLEGAK